MLVSTNLRRLLQANRQPLTSNAHKIRHICHTLAPKSDSNPTNLFPSSISIFRAQQVARHLSTTAERIIEMSSLPISDKGYNPNAPGQYTVRKNGAANTPDYRIYIEKDGVPVSPFHDIPLYANEQQTVLNMVVEIPRWTNAKMEVCFRCRLSLFSAFYWPAADVIRLSDLQRRAFKPYQARCEKGQTPLRPQLLSPSRISVELRCFPPGAPFFGLPTSTMLTRYVQTWEDPNVVHPETKAKGDNDPLDVCEIGELVGTPGQIKQVKVLGVMALLDEEETDWKIIVIDVNDPLAPRLNDIEDVERHLPGLLRATNEWFRIYKIPDGKPENQFAFSGECKNKKSVQIDVGASIADRYADTPQTLFANVPKHGND